MNESNPPETLFNEAPQPPGPGPAGPGPLELVVGIFTEPAALFQRLSATPVWGWSLAITTAFNVLVTVLWGLKVDVDAMLRPVLEANPKVPADQIDRIIQMQAKFILPFGVVMALFGVAAFGALAAFLYWLVGRSTAENRPPSYAQAFSATMALGLVTVPRALLIALLCVLKNIGGLTPEKVAPTSVGYFLQVDQVKLQAFLYAMDLFNFASLGLLYLAARHALRLKPLGAFLCVLLAAALTVGFPVLFAK